MDLIPTQNAITAQEYLNREDMSLVLYRMKSDVTTSSTIPLNQGTENTKVAKSFNFVYGNKCGIKLVAAKLLDKFFPADFCHYINYPNSFTYLNTIQNSEDKAVQITEVSLYMSLRIIHVNARN